MMRLMVILGRRSGGEMEQVVVKDNAIQFPSWLDFRSQSGCVTHVQMVDVVNAVVRLENRGPMMEA